MTTEQRLERLERENRWMRRIGAAGVAVALVALAAVFLVERGTVHTHQLPQLGEELLDLEVRSLTVKDKDGKSRVSLRTDADGATVLIFADGAGKARAGLLTTPDGRPFLYFADKAGETRFLVEPDADGAVGLCLFDKNGTPRAEFGAVHAVNEVTRVKTKTSENTLTLRDAEGNVIWQAPR